MPRMSEDELTSIVSNEIQSAIGFHADEFEEERMRATDYYHGRAIGDEREGFSQVVSTDVHDSIEYLMPSIMRVFTETENYVEFTPRGPEDVQSAKQASQYCNWVINSANDGWTILHNFFKDALLYKLGVIKVHVEDKQQVDETEVEGVTFDDLQMLLDDDSVELVGTEMRDDGLYDVAIKRVTENKRIVLENVPPEEFLISTRAKSIDDARFVGHRTMMTMSDLIEMGVDPDLLEEYASQVDPFVDQEIQQRHQEFDSGTDRNSLDPSQAMVEVVEAFMHVDYDGDGIAELRRLFTVGDGAHIIQNDPYDVKPFAVVSPILVPHRAIGRSVAELLFTTQVVKSQLQRQMLDNIYRLNNARLAYVDGQVNQDDILRNAPGSPIRMRAPGMVQEIKPQGLVQDSLAAINYIDHVREEKTGVSKAAQGLDADSLQSTTAVAVNATISAAAGKVEMYVRTFAETGVKQLFRLILKRAMEFDIAPTVIRLRNEFVTMDPSTWKTEYDMTVNVGLGTGQTQEKMASLMAIAAKQEQILLQAGMDNPLVKPHQYAATLTKLVELAGFKDTQSYVARPEMVMQEMQMQQQAAAQQGPQMTPEMMQAQAEVQMEQMKAQAQLDIERFKAQAKAELDRQIAEARLEIERYKAGVASDIKYQELEVEAQLEGIRTAENLPGGNADLNLNG